MPSLRIKRPVILSVVSGGSRGSTWTGPGRWAGAVLFSLLALGTHTGCVQIDGGAIEASWVLRTFDGRAIETCDCSVPAVARVRFVVNAIDAAGKIGADICAGQAGCEFSCGSQRGATPFFVPAARYAIAVLALDATGTAVPEGNESGTVRLQAPILRDVVFGQPAQLEAFAIVASCDAKCGGDQTTRACSRD